ncbi:MAG: alpha-2-macroglobulin family protein [Cytophagales bacterium]|nr:MG2 domain-containing protein [Bernardetiaceae bacterium]MDW8203456.1 alpha-2-macroglobulin family protein [Cytophagales bacterium]
MHFLPFFWSIMSLWLGLASPQTYQQTSDPQLVTNMPPDSLYYRRMWKSVDSLLQKSLEKQALVKVTEIYKRAAAEKNYPQQIKAFVQQINLRSTTEEEEQNLFKALQEETERQPAPAKQVLRYFLAKSYADYLSNNSWRMEDRTATADEDRSDNPETWSKRKLLSEIHRLYLASLEDAPALQKIRIEEWRELFSARINPNKNELEGSRNRRYRPTLYDFLAHAAVDYLINSESIYEKVARPFEINSAEFFAPLPDFEKLTFNTPDSANTQLAAVRILQQLAAFHRLAGNTDALADLDLKRLDLMHRQATFADKDNVYEQALAAAEKTYAGTPVAADFAYEQAVLYRERGQKFNRLMPDDPNRFMLKKSLEIAEAAVQKYPKTQGANNCQQLIQRLKMSSFSVKAEAVNAAQQPFRLLLTHQNLPQVWCKAVPLTDEDIQQIKNWNTRDVALRKLFAAQGITWNVALPSDGGDMQSHATEIAAPALNWGKYLLIVADNQRFANSEKGEKVAYGVLTISDMAFMERRHNGLMEYFLADRNTGAPIARAKVEVALRQYNYRNSRYERSPYQTLTTDAEGMVRIAERPETKPANMQQGYANFSVTFIHPNGKDRLSNATEGTIVFNTYGGSPEEKLQTHAHFFTDRNIYRPGQTIYYKVILTQKQNGERRPLSNADKITVALFDANGQQVAQQEVAINEFGSGSGSFVAPTGGLNGEMRLVALGNAYYFRVEDYKRPKFEVKMDAVAKAVRLGDEVEATGFAQAYSGAAVDRAKVNYRVVRKPYNRFRPWWWYWYQQDETPTEIAKGTLQTDAAGKFSIKFPALPDNATARNLQPLFDFEISVDVTDINGETQSTTKNIFIGYNAISLNADISEKIALEKGSEKVKISALNAEQQNVATQGTAKLIKLKAPNRIFRERLWEQPDLFAMSREEFYKQFPNDPYAAEHLMPNWEAEKTIGTFHFDTEKQPEISLPLAGIGAYLLEISAKDPFGSEVSSRRYFTVYAEKSGQLPYPVALWEAALPSAKGSSGAVEPSDAARWQIGSSFSGAYIRYETEAMNELASSNALKISNQAQIQTFAVEERHRGNVAMRAVMIRNGRFYQVSRLVQVPHTNKQLNIRFETFRNKLLPGEKEEWRLKISNKDGTADRAIAEMVATLYDASLDAFGAHSFDFPAPPTFGIAYNWRGQTFGSQSFNQTGSNPYTGNLQYRYYDALQMLATGIGGMGGYYQRSRILYSKRAVRAEQSDYEISMVSPMEEMADDAPEENMVAETVATGSTEDKKPEKKSVEQPKVRTNFNETAFFYPHLQTDAEGNLIIRFTLPESLTRWKMLGFAHKKDMRYGFVENELVAQKDLMVVPNPPRFFRERDEMVFAAKITNLSDKELTGEAQIRFFDAITMQPIDVQMYPRMVEAMSPQAIAEARSKKPFTVAKGQSTAVSWTIQIPDGTVQAITYRITAQAGNFSDGEEMTLPVLTDRMLLTETLPLPVRGGQTKTFELKKLTDSRSQSLRHQSLTLEFTNNPAWYALQALPYLMEYPHECAEQTFSRFYANSIATHVVNSSPQIKAVFDTWQQQNGGSALASNLQKNEELKYLLLQETPWVRQALNEADRKRTVAVLFDLMRMSRELEAALTKLEKMQYPNGGFPWFEGMPESRWVTQHIAAGLGHLNRLGVLTVRPDASVNAKPAYNPAIDANRTWAMLQRAVNFLDQKIFEDYQQLKKLEKEGKIKMSDPHIGYEHYHYLYMRSFFGDIEPLPNFKIAIQYFTNQAEQYWTKTGLYTQGMTALALHRTGRTKTAQTIAQSLRERAIVSEEMGMYWKANRSYWWYELPIETQALMIEVFGEVAQDAQAVNDLKVWLLKQKQTQDWKTTKATAEAVYALLLQGDNWLAETAMADIRVGTQKIDPSKIDGVKVEAGTGYFQVKWNRGEIKPEMGKVTISKPGKGIAWGGLYWQYFEDLDKITPAETPLKLRKQLYIERVTDKGLVLEPITGQTPVKIGDKVKVRIELQVDRAMEYVHLKDMRAAGFEPLNTLSGYRWQGGLGYYESTRDAATHFFFGWLPQGTHVFEYALRATQAGDFSNGVATIQCMYAPEFTSHSAGIRVQIVE